MKEGILAFVISSWIFLVIYVFLIYTPNQRELEKKIDMIEELIKSQNYKDSLMFEFYRKSPFIDKDSIGVGYDGYLYSKYHRKYKIVQK